MSNKTGPFQEVFAYLMDKVAPLFSKTFVNYYTY